MFVVVAGGVKADGGLREEPQLLPQRGAEYGCDSLGVLRVKKDLRLDP